jgi:hypothetical protein
MSEINLNTGDFEQQTTKSTTSQSLCKSQCKINYLTNIILIPYLKKINSNKF